MKYILVTGGAGFIGSSLCERLINNGERIICFDNFDTFYPRIYKTDNISTIKKNPSFILIEGNINNPEELNEVFLNYKIEHVIHLAAKAGIRPSIENPLEYVETNINGTANLLESMLKFGVYNIIFSSSSSVYGNNVEIPYLESCNIDYPISPYAATKKCGELLTHTYYHLHHFNVINLRFFTVYGPRQRPDLAIHKFFQKTYSNKPIDVYGDGSSSRDYTYIDDIVHGICSSLQYLKNNTNIYETINLGNSNPIKLFELINLIEKITEKKIIINHLPFQKGEVNITYANIRKAKEILSYNPKTNMMDGLLKFNEWFLKNNNI